jgi:hypothetical protein
MRLTIVLAPYDSRYSGFGHGPDIPAAVKALLAVFPDNMERG